jgi:hypothetical protein
MANKKPAEMSNEQLLAAEKKSKVLIPMLIICSVLMLASGILLTVKQRFSSLIVIPLAFTPIIIMGFKSLKEMKEEKQKRGLS